MGNLERGIVDSKTPNVLILVFDALSAKHMSLYNYPRDTTPNIKRFAERANVYHNHYAAGSFTTPSTASLFTGVYPWLHKAYHIRGSISNAHFENNIFNLIPRGVHKTVFSHNQLAYTLQNQLSIFIDQLKPPRDLALFDGQYSDILFPDDYQVSSLSEKAIMIGDDTLKPTSPLLSLGYLYRLFFNKSKIIEETSKQFPLGIPQMGNLFYILEDFTNWVIDNVNQFPKPFFSYLHALPPHGPYKTRRDFKGLFEDTYLPVSKPDHHFSQGENEDHLNKLSRKYDEFLAYTDHEFGRLLDSLDNNGLLDTTYLILTSDHGEMFERGIRGHLTETLYEPLIKVPLLVSTPGQSKRVDIHEPTSTVDILPTVSRIYNQPFPEWSEGSILPGVNRESSSIEREVYTIEAKSNPKHGKLEKSTISLIKGGRKLICYSGYEGMDEYYEFFDLKNDPEELENNYSTTNEDAQSLKQIMKEKLSIVNEK